MSRAILLNLGGSLSAKEVSTKLGVRVDEVWKAWSFYSFLEDIKS